MGFNSAFKWLILNKFFLIVCYMFLLLEKPSLRRKLI